MKKNTNDTVQEEQVLTEPAAPADSKTEPEAQTEDKPLKFAVASSTGLNVRSGPGLQHAILRQLACGDVVEVKESLLKVLGGGLWAPVEGGWVAAEFLALIDEEA